MNMNKLTNSDILESLVPDPASREFLIALMNTLPGIVAILDYDRRLVFCNSNLENIIGDRSLASAFNLRPGEIFQCVNAHKTPGGCGTAEACDFCGALSAMQQSRSEQKTKSNKYRILSSRDGHRIAYNFRFTSTPFRSQGTFYYAVSLEDISNQNRKAELERIFYHDLMNSLGSLQGVINLIKEKDQSDPFYIEILESTYNALFDTINEQKQYTLAERGELAVRNEELHTRDLLIETVLPFSKHSDFTSRVELEEEIADVIFESDPALLCRVLTNMIKNALEASDQNNPVRVGVDLSDGQLRFRVHNQEVIPLEIQQQIFERSFSSKGQGRGLGTFSMKLLGEAYLGGKVDFVSDEKHGTTFMIDLPVK